MLPFLLRLKGNERMKTLLCPLCESYLGKYDGKAKIDKIFRCCNKKIIYRCETKTYEIKKLELKKTISGMTFM